MILKHDQKTTSHATCCPSVHSAAEHAPKHKKHAAVAPTTGSRAAMEELDEEDAAGALAVTGPREPAGVPVGRALLGVRPRVRPAEGAAALDSSLGVKQRCV